jgi:hypothetical protein
MRLQEYMVHAIQKQAQETFRYAKAVPEEKLQWSPLQGARTVLSICQELAMTPTWAVDTIQGNDQWTEEEFAEQKKIMDSWETVDACEKEFQSRFERLRELYLSLPEEKLAETRWLRYEGGRDFTYAEMLEYPRWNLNYHLGQIAYIQTLYGDREMY